MSDAAFVCVTICLVTVLFLCMYLWDEIGWRAKVDQIAFVRPEGSFDVCESCNHNMIEVLHKCDKCSSKRKDFE